MNQKQNNLNSNNFNIQGNNRISNNQPLQDRQSFNNSFNSNVGNVNGPTFNAQSAIKPLPPFKSPPTNSFQQPIIQDPQPQPVSSFESNNNQSFNNKLTQKMNNNEFNNFNPQQNNNNLQQENFDANTNELSRDSKVISGKQLNNSRGTCNINKKATIIICSIIAVLILISLVLAFTNDKKDKTYNVSFETNGGTVVNSQIVNEGEVVVKPTDPLKEGYIFIQWLYEGQTYDFSSVVNSDLVLIADFIEKKEEIETFAVVFDSAGGTTISNQIIDKGNRVTKPTDPSKEGYIFKGWVLNGEFYDFTSIIASDIELKAKWEKVENDNNKGCTLSVTEGTIGLKDWYISDVTLSLAISGENISNYGITTSSKASYNGKKSLKITNNHNTKIYYGHVKYKNGTTKVCDISIKIDKTKPTIPTSVIKKNSSSGEIISNSPSYRNYRVWWGNFNSIDKDSGIDYYEYSSGCTGVKDYKLNSEYIYPWDKSGLYEHKYCIRAVDIAGNYSDWSSAYYFNIDLIKPTCSVKMTANSSTDILTVLANDSNSGIAFYSYNSSSYTSSNVYNVKKGTKVTVTVKDKAGNIGHCQNYKKALILVGDSRTHWLQYHLGGKQILTNYEDIYSIESYDEGKKEVYAVAKSGAFINWFLGKELGYADGKYKVAGAYQVQTLLTHLSKQPIYYDVVIASNLGVNDLNYYSAEDASSTYISAYNKLLNSSQSVYVNDKIVNGSWKKTGNVIGVQFKFISVNPIDEKLLNAYVKDNKRTTSIINSYNNIMKQTYGSNYLDSSSKFNNWFSQTVNAGQPRFVYKTCIDSNNNKYTCEDGLHYSSYMDKNYIYGFYKSNLLD